MGKSISLKTKDGKEYVLEYTRRTVELAEMQGLDINELADKPAHNIPILVRGAFLKNHKGTSKDEIDAIYDSIKDKSKFLECLLELYRDSIESLIVDKEDNEGNSQWEMIG